MARSAVQAKIRVDKLTKLLSGRQNISTVELAKRFGVSQMTIHRDLKKLEATGAVVRCYGGAIPAQRISFEFQFDERHQKHLAEKKRIGQMAADVIQDGQIVMLDTGTTTLEIAKRLAASSISCTIITSSLVIASVLWSREGIELMLAGGRVRAGNPDMIGPVTEIMLERMTADIAFLGTDGIDPARGCFTGAIETARVAEKMANSARKVIVVTDSSKLGLAGSARYLRINDMNELITDKAADASAVKSLKKQGVVVSLV